MTQFLATCFGEVGNEWRLEKCLFIMKVHDDALGSIKLPLDFLEGL